MEIVLLLLKQSLIMFVYLLIGYLLYKKKLVSKQGSADMGRMLLYVIMPVAILKSYIRDFSTDLLEGLIVSFVLALLSLILSVVVSRVLFQKDEGVERFGAAFSNAGFIGIPLVQMALGSEAVFYVASFVAILNILQWTYGVLVLTGSTPSQGSAAERFAHDSCSLREGRTSADRSVIRPRKLCTNPIVISFLAGLLLFFAPVTLPDMLTDIISTLSSMNGPVAMIVLGVYLGQVPLKSLFTDRLAYKCAAVRLVLIPALTIVLMLAVPAEYQTIKLTVLIAASAPVGSNVAIFAQLYDQDYTRAVREVCLSTLLCIITLPLIVGVANLFF